MFRLDMFLMSFTHLNLIGSAHAGGMLAGTLADSIHILQKDSNVKARFAQNIPNIWGEDYSEDLP